ncbi:MAG TPA: peptidoglycan-binding domain-containing protein [Chthoniobacteraceae bacterium]|jgi:peptidoglycan hydrolase-like protein with peptidoglycan-binding domain|nr:hypothetical protein [Chthoniobacter sp.]HEV7869265.1 peptidoglycan-binding domain-containing protein [Chthoniobacteraceae bacterium]
MKTLVACLASLMLLSGSRAQAPEGSVRGPLASVQKTLKEQQFYFGEVTGTLDAETRAAFRRFQIHRGLPVTGEMDTATLENLQTAATDTGSRSVRALAQESAQDDQEFLERLESADPPEAATAPRVQAAVPPPRPIEQAPRPRTSNLISKEEADEFVRDYLKAAEQTKPDEEISFYADQVNYFGSGRVTRKFVEKDQRNYYRRWPSRSFTLTSGPEVLRADESRTSLRFRIRYALRGPEGSAKGETENIVQLSRTDDGLKIAGIQERKR